MCEIVYAALLLSEMDCQKDPDLVSGIINGDKDWPNMSSWYDVGSKHCVPQYQTTPVRWTPFTPPKSRDLYNAPIQYIIGNDLECNNSQLFCNGPLKPSKYLFDY